MGIDDRDSWLLRHAFPTARATGWRRTGCVLSVYAPDEDAVRARYEAALAAGGTGVYEPSQQAWSAFAAQVADPDGHLWMILVPPPDWADWASTVIISEAGRSGTRLS